jgi:hypothetical protein
MFQFNTMELTIGLPVISAFPYRRKIDRTGQTWGKSKSFSSLYSIRRLSAEVTVYHDGIDSFHIQHIIRVRLE